MSRLVHALSAQDPSPLLSAALCKFREQPALATARFCFQEHEAALTRPRLRQLRMECRQFLPATDKRWLGQRAAPIVQAHDKRWLRLASLHGFGDDPKVSPDGLRRLIAVPRILAQQPLDDFIQRLRHRQPQASQFGRPHGQVLAQHFPHVAPVKRRASGQALEEDDSHRVQVGARRNFLVQQTRSLG